MSEYQYYEFRTIDKPLDKAAQKKLRELSSRAEITSTSLTNEYQYGDFRGDPDDLMRKYFDAFLNFANWGTHRLMFRLPRGCLDAKAVKAYSVEYLALATFSADHIILDFHSGEDLCDEEWREWRLGEFLPLRADLMAGDMRCLYLAWLSGVDNHEVEDADLEPPVPPGLQTLSGPLTEFAQFLYLDEDLIAAAAENSAPEQAEASLEEMAAWIAGLPIAEKDDLLLRLMQGESPGLGGELIARFRQPRKSLDQGGDGLPRRSAEQLRIAAEAQRGKRDKKEAERKARKEQEKAKERAKYLESLVGKEDALWRQIDQLVEAKKSQHYEEAVTLLKDLHELWQQGKGKEFTKPLLSLKERHSGKAAFKRKLKEAGLV